MGRLDKISAKRIINEIGINLTGRHIEIVLNHDPELIQKMSLIIEQADHFLSKDAKRDFVEEGFKAIIDKFPDKINKRALLLLTIYDMQTTIEEKQKSLDKKQIAILKKNIAKGIKMLDKEDFNITSIIMDEKNELATGIEVVNSAEVVNYIRKGKKMKFLQDRDLQKDERLEKINEEIGLAHIFQIMEIYDIEKIISKNPEIGYTIVEHLSNNLIKRYIVEHPEVVDKLVGGMQIPEDLEQNMKQSKYYKEAVEEAIKADIKYIDIDKMLLVAGLRDLELLETSEEPIVLCLYSDDGKVEEQTPEESIKIIKNMVLLMSKQIKEGTKITDSNGQEYTLENLKQNMRKFVGNRYIKESELQELKQKLMEGEVNLQDIEKGEALLVDLTGNEISKLMEKSEENLFFFLENNIISGKTDMFGILYLRKKCSDKLFDYIIQNQLLDSAQICCLFEDNIINLEQIAKLKDTYIMKEMQIPERIKEIYMSVFNSEKEAKQEEIEILNKYVKIYRMFMIDGKTDEEIQKNTLNIINAFEEDISDDVLKGLYEFGLISLDSAIDWGVNPMEMLEENSMKPTDLKGLYAKKIIDIEAIRNVLLQTDLQYEEKLDLIYSTFDGESEEEYKLREELVQLLEPIDEYKVENSENESNRSKGIGKKSREYVTDPHARWKLTSLIDKDYSRKFLPRGFEVRDGHSITLLPNHDMIMIEKMYDKRSGKVVNAYKKRTWIVPSEEFFKNIDEIIVNGTINRPFLSELWREGKVDGIIHSTAWGRKIKEYFNINEENEKYTKNEIEEIDRAIEMVNNSRKERE